MYKYWFIPAIHFLFPVVLRNGVNGISRKDSMTLRNLNKIIPLILYVLTKS